jgi:hypothetical protein
LADLPDEDLIPRAEQLARPYTSNVLGVDQTRYSADEAGLVRTLLRSISDEGAIPTVDVLTERERDDSGASGSYDTPAPLAELMADLLPAVDGSFPSSVFDPACGAGALLVAAAQRGAVELYGQDVVPTLVSQTAVRLGVLAPAAKAVVAGGDSLRADAFPALTTQSVLCAPPYGDRDWGHEELAYDPRWIYGLPPKGEPELAWVQHCLAHLEAGGSAVLLMPPAAAERASGRRIRAELLRSGAVRAVVGLPAGVAPPLHVGLHLWVLYRPHPQAAAPQTVLFIDTVRSDSRQPPAASMTKRTTLDWPTLHETVRNAWNSYAMEPDRFDDIPGTARVVPVIDLLDESVDLTPARHVRTAPVAMWPDRHAEAAQALRSRLRQAAADLAALSDGETWVPAGEEPRSWRTATVADLLRGGALTLLRATPAGRGATTEAAQIRVEVGDVIIPALPQPGAARVAEAHDAGQPLGRGSYLLRPDPDRLDPWFLAGFLAAEDNVHAASTGSSVVRVDARRLRVPLLPLAEQRRYGDAFRRLAALRAAADIASRLADDTVRALSSGLTGGALLPPDLDQTAS